MRGPRSTATALPSCATARWCPATRSCWPPSTSWPTAATATPLAGIEFTKLGVSYQQALADYISEDLGGTITAADYPAGGDNRIVALAAEPEPTPTPEPETMTVTVKRGDSLWKLARIHLESGARWQEIYDLNRGRPQADGRTLSNPNFILIGWVLELPSN